jgi:hypothetical protein
MSDRPAIRRRNGALINASSANRGPHSQNSPYRKLGQFEIDLVAQESFFARRMTNWIVGRPDEALSKFSRSHLEVVPATREKINCFL